LLAIGECLEALESLVHVHLPRLHTERLQPVDEGMSSGMLAEDDAVRLQPHGLRLHDLVSLAVLEDAVLMNSRFMREGVVADDRLVDRDRLADDLREQAAG